MIAFVTLYLTHGVSPTTTVALAGTLGALFLTLVLSWVFFDLTRITGFGAEENLLLPFLAGDIDLAGLLLGGAVIGTLGALDDITVTQVAAVSEIHARRPDLTVSELVASGIRVGREHIAPTVNTLLLAYAGASLPILCCSRSRISRLPVSPTPRWWRSRSSALSVVRSASSLRYPHHGDGCRGRRRRSVPRSPVLRHRLRRGVGATLGGLRT